MIYTHHLYWDHIVYIYINTTSSHFIPAFCDFIHILQSNNHKYVEELYIYYYIVYKYTQIYNSSFSFIVIFSHLISIFISSNLTFNHLHIFEICRRGKRDIVYCRVELFVWHKSIDLIMCASFCIIINLACHFLLDLFKFFDRSGQKIDCNRSVLFEINRLNYFIIFICWLKKIYI